MMTKNSYSKFEYQDAKKFLKVAKQLSCFSNSGVSRSTKYQMPDGSVWREFESLLETPEDDYSLDMITAAPHGNSIARRTRHIPQPLDWAENEARREESEYSHSDGAHQ